jgi:hypothetical protein
MYRLVRSDDEEDEGMTSRSVREKGCGLLRYKPKGRRRPEASRRQAVGYKHWL